MRKGAKVPSDFELQERRHEVASFYLQGYLLKDIAAKYSLSIVQIHRDIKTIREGWQRENLHNINEIINRELIGKLGH